MKLSIIITTRNRKEVLLRCTDSVRGSTYKDYELIIIDDASNDGTEKLTPRQFESKTTKVIHNPKQLMMVRSRNLGAKEACGDMMLFIDDDNIVDKKMIEVLVKFASTNPDYGIVGPVMCFQDGTPYLNYQKIDLLTGMTKGIRVKTLKSIGLDSDGIPNVFLIKREVFEKVGYFEEELIQTYTEVNFAFKARKYGFKCGICQKAYTCHDVLPEENFTPRILGGGGGFTQKAYCLMRNRMIIVKRYSSLFGKIIFFLFSSWFWPLVYTVLVIKYRRWDLIKLYWLGFRDGLYYFLTDRMVSAIN